jgi:hypothetical protein
VAASGAAVLLGRQEPTFLWCPTYEYTLGPEAIRHSAQAGLVWDPWQCTLANHGLAETAAGRPRFFTVGVTISRQNGKDALLEGIELFWLYVLGVKEIIHSAHLANTSRKHFFRLLRLIESVPHLKRRLHHVRRGKGDESIELTPIRAGQQGPTIEFRTRAGGQSRGDVADKVIYNECMYLDADAVAASLPTMATRPDGQVWFVGSAGFKTSIQQARVRNMALDGVNDSLMYAEWAAEPWVPEHLDPLTGQMVAARGDRPDVPETWAKVNPGYARRITESYIRNEAGLLGGFDSVEFGTERLGIGDWPKDGQAWAVIDKDAWVAAEDPDSQIADDSRVAFAAHTDPAKDVTTVSVAGWRADGKAHVEVLARHRGNAWVVDALGQLTSTWKPLGILVLKTSATTPVINDAEAAKVPVRSPTTIEYAQACARFRQRVVERGTVVHMAQASLTRSIAGVRPLANKDGGWVFDPASMVDIGPAVTVALALRELEIAEPRNSWVWTPEPAAAVAGPAGVMVARRGATGLASARRGRS